MTTSLKPTTAFWSGKRVFLTGHTGFKGAWLALWLRRLGAEVRGFALPPDTEPNMFARLRLAEDLDHVVGDLRELDAVVRAVEGFQPEIVLHLGAQAIVRRAHREPVDTFATNLLGTVHVLEACRLTPSVRAAVLVTTDKCYENPEWVWPFREVDRLGGHEPYSASKACAELATAAYRQAYLEPAGACRAATGRAGNVIGGGDWSEARLIPDAVRAVVAGQPLRVRNQDSVRPWQHVVEPLLGYLMLAKALHTWAPDCPSALNFGPSPQQFAPVKRVADTFFAAWGAPTGWSYEPEANAPREARLLRLDSSLAAETLGWTPSGSLEEAIAETARWYKAEAQGALGARAHGSFRRTNWAPFSRRRVTTESPTPCLVTGATGFLGGALVERLLAQGRPVVAVVRRPSGAERLPANVVTHVHDGSTESLQLLVAGLTSRGPLTIFHLAADLGAGGDRAAAILAANVALSTQLAEACRLVHDSSGVVCRFVVAGSYWQYDRHGSYRPNTLYAAAKHAGQCILDYYAQTGALRVVTLIMFDLYGPGDPRDKLIPAVLKAARDGARIETSPGLQRVDFVQVDDAVDALLAGERFLEGPEWGEHARFGVSTGRLVTVRELVATAAKVTQREIDVAWGARPYPEHQIMEPVETLPRLPGWSPQRTLEQGLQDAWRALSAAGKD